MKCSYILLRGSRKGTPCGRSCYGAMCYRHKPDVLDMNRKRSTAKYEQCLAIVRGSAVPMKSGEQTSPAICPKVAKALKPTDVDNMKALLDCLTLCREISADFDGECVIRSNQQVANKSALETAVESVLGSDIHSSTEHHVDASFIPFEDRNIPPEVDVKDCAACEHADYKGSGYDSGE